MNRQLRPTQPNFLSQCCGAAPSPLTPDVSADNLAGICGACHHNTVFEVDPDTVDWRTHTHAPGADEALRLDRQHGPNLHTHGTDGKVDTVMGLSVAGLDELEQARLERAAAGQGPNEFYPTDAPDVCYHCGADLDGETDSEFCADCREAMQQTGAGCVLLSEGVIE